VYRDTAEGVSILANRIETNSDSGTMRATMKPLMIIKQENDSIYIAADTLYSGRMRDLEAMMLMMDTASRKDSTRASLLPVANRDSAGRNPIADSGRAVPAIDTSQRQIQRFALKDTGQNKNDSADRYFQAYHNVRIFSDSLQAVSDSLFYSGRDSIFRLFTNPVMWTGNSQVTGDTIYLYTKNKKPDQIQVFENGMAVEKSGPQMFNQVRGNRMFAWFIDGNIDLMRAKGNAESVYYVLDDDSAIVGVNKVGGDIIDLRFSNKELNRVVVIGQPAGTLVPVMQATEQDRILRGFNWLDARRPKTKFELFEN
jgi:hypothetical protein